MFITVKYLVFLLIIRFIIIHIHGLFGILTRCYLLVVLIHKLLSDILLYTPFLITITVKYLQSENDNYR